MQSKTIEIPSEAGTELPLTKVIVEKVFYTSGNGYAVILVRPSGYAKGNYTFTAVGTIGDVREEETLVIAGKSTENKYGVQLQISELQVPDLSGDNMYEFLVGGFIDGIGEAIGQRIWDYFGNDTLYIFDNEPDKLLEVKGIKETKLETIMDSWERVRGRRVALVEFANMGLHTGQISNILKKWQNPLYALSLIKENPYVLAWEISGVGFRTADAIAYKLGIAPNSPQRYEAALGYALDESALTEGHCYLPFSRLIEKTRELLNAYIDENELTQILYGLKDKNKVVFFTNNCGELCIYLQTIYKAELSLALNIQRLIKKQSWLMGNIQPMIQGFEAKNHIRLHVSQKEAIVMACQNQCSVITGGPGTGKTTIIKCLIQTLKNIDPHCRIALAAPTGRAAKRMTESTGIEAKTIHRLLEFNPQEGFHYNKDNKLPVSAVIVDESSMLDVRLANSLLSAVADDTKFVFVGDVNQLPSVGAGAVLKDVINCRSIPVTFLSQIYRQSEGSYIAVNAQAILHGQFNQLNLTNKTDDFFFMGIRNPNQPNTEKQTMLRDGLVKCVSALLNKGHGIPDIQILCPSRNGPLGVIALNALIQEQFNSESAILYENNKVIFRLGDKVMQTKNNYDKNVYNGDLGYIVDGDSQTLYVEYDSNVIEYKKDTINELALAYAMTIHKSQGSETPVAIVLLSYSHYIMLSRPIFYTAVTRAKQMCVLLGEIPAIKKAVDNNNVNFRNTSLVELLSNGNINQCANY